MNQESIGSTMIRRFGERWCWLVCCLAWLGGPLGCASRAKDMDRFVPSSDVASEALTTALTAWQKNELPGAIRGTSTAVEVVDSHRTQNQRLLEFEILGEVGSDSGRCFSVRLELDEPTEVQKVRFVVIGVNPLWVFREEDYTMLSHWEHPMPEEPAAEEKKDPS